MTPQEIHTQLWIARGALEEIYLDSNRVVSEMINSVKIANAIKNAFESTEIALLGICDEYIWPLEDAEEEEEARKNEAK